jgi:alkyl hydroperoxide reductase subunit F
MYDLIILGGGPAGAAAGVYAARKKIKTLLLTQSFGGQSVVSAEIKNFIGFKTISGVELAKRLEEHLSDQDGIEVKSGVLISKIEKTKNGFKVFSDASQVYETRTLLVALGSRYRRLNIPGEDKFEGKGVFYCSICDAPLLKGKTAAVVGGGNSGFEAAIDLLPYASKIYLFEYTDILRADLITQEKVKASGKAEIIMMAEVQEIFGDRFVSGLKYKDRVSGEAKELKLDGVFVAVGYQPNSDLVKDLVELNSRGEIVVNHQTQKTSCEGIWAAGDISDVLYNQINIAIGDAIKAVLNIYEHLKNK